MQLGARGVINRKKFNCWGELPKVGTPEYDAWFKEARKFGAAIWEITGKGNNVDFVFEHPGAATFPVSVFVVKRGGMVVICAGTTGYNLTMDARYLWMHQKRVQGSHFANLLQAAQANKLVVERRVDPGHVGGVPLGADPQGAHAHVEERAQARQHGRARQRPDHGPAHLRGRHRGKPQALRLTTALACSRSIKDDLALAGQSAGRPARRSRSSMRPRFSSAPRITMIADDLEEHERAHDLCQARVEAGIVAECQP